MGQLHAEQATVRQRVLEMRQNSSLFDSMLYEILADGDLTIFLSSQGHSWYENRIINVSLQENPKEMDILSTIVMEICNACGDVRGEKPAQKAFASATAYGAAVERHEWSAIRKHIAVLKQLSMTPLSLGKSRFEQAFEDPRYAWGNFDNYLAYQRQTGHTQQIESHWKP